MSATNNPTQDQDPIMGAGLAGEHAATAAAEMVLVPDWLAAGDLEREVRLAPRVSAAAVEPYWSRLDLFYACELWERDLDWRVAAKAEQRDEPNGLGATRRVTRWVPNPTDKHNPYLDAAPTVRSIIGFLAGYHAASAPQLAAAAGVDYKTAQVALKRAFEGGLLQRGKFVSGSWQYPTPYLYKLRKGPELTRWLRALTDADTLAVGAGEKVGLGPGHDKHNLLVAELALRAAETHPDLAAVFGENLASPSLLLPGTKSNARGDLVLVRGDGLKVVVEFVQASQTRELVEKMTRWGRILGSRHWNTSGLVVVFVAGNSATHRAACRQLVTAHEAALTAESLGENGVPASPEQVRLARAQIHVASWRDWFPAPYRVSTEFDQLTVAASNGTRWARVPLAAWPFKPTHPEWFAVPAAAAKQLAQVPDWIGGPAASRLDA